MKSRGLLYFLAVVALAGSALARADGKAPARVDSLDQARRIVQADPAKHVLIFYTNYRS